LVSPVKLTTRSDQLHILGSGLREQSLRELLLIHPVQIRRGIDDLGHQGFLPAGQRPACPGTEISCTVVLTLFELIAWRRRSASA